MTQSASQHSIHQLAMIGFFKRMKKGKDAKMRWERETVKDVWLKLKKRIPSTSQLHLLNFRNGKAQIHEILKNGAKNREAKLEKNTHHETLPPHFSTNHLDEVVITTSAQPQTYDEGDVQLVYAWLLEHNKKCKLEQHWISDYYKHLRSSLLSQQSTRSEVVPITWLEKGLMPSSYLVDFNSDPNDDGLEEPMYQSGRLGAYGLSSKPNRTDLYHYYCDGSCTGNKLPASQKTNAGWGYAVLNILLYLDDSFGPIILDITSPWYIGADVFQIIQGSFVQCTNQLYILSIP